MKTASGSGLGFGTTSDEAFGTERPMLRWQHGFPAGNDLIGVPEVDLLGG